METITIASIEKQPPKQADWSPTYKIKTSAGETCYANVGNWNANWAPGMQVQVVKEKKADKKYFNLKCPEDLKPKPQAANMEPVMDALRKLYAKVHEVEKKVDRLQNYMVQQDGVDVFPPEDDVGDVR